MVEQVSHSGTISKNPYNFKHFDCSEASIVVNGVHEPSEPYKLNIDAGDYINLYSDFLLNTGIATEDRDFGIDFMDYMGGWRSMFNLSKSASLRPYVTLT